VDDRIGLLLKVAQHALRTSMDDELRTYGTTTPQYAALASLEAAGELSNAELARRCFVSSQTMNELFAVLSKQGLVARQAHPSNRRIQLIALTNLGRERLRDCHGVVAEVESRMTAGLTGAETLELARMLRNCTESLGSFA